MPSIYKSWTKTMSQTTIAQIVGQYNIICKGVYKGYIGAGWLSTRW